MTTKKKVAAKAAAKAPVRRIKPGPNARAKARRELENSEVRGRAIGAAIATAAGPHPDLKEHWRRLAELEERRLKAQAESAELANEAFRREKGLDLNTKVNFNYQGTILDACDVRASQAANQVQVVQAPKALAGLEDEMAQLENCQAFTADLVAGLAKRLDNILKPPSKDDAGSSVSPARTRSGIADWLANKVSRQAAINAALQELHARLDLG